jgi:hypothetical protein
MINNMKEIKMYDGDMIARYEETDEKKQQLWDAFIKWCTNHNASTGESIQSDNFVIDAPEFMVDVIDEIICFETE